MALRFFIRKCWAIISYTLLHAAHGSIDLYHITFSRLKLYYLLSPFLHRRHFTPLTIFTALLYTFSRSTVIFLSCEASSACCIQSIMNLYGNIRMLSGYFILQHCQTGRNVGLNIMVLQGVTWLAPSPGCSFQHPCSKVPFLVSDSICFGVPKHGADLSGSPADFLAFCFVISKNVPLLWTCKNRTSRCFLLHQ